nr:MAG TPA: hypothetical protein [Caudoviricetes sp.]
MPFRLRWLGIIYESFAEEGPLPAYRSGKGPSLQALKSLAYRQAPVREPQTSLNHKWLHIVTA